MEEFQRNHNLHNNLLLEESINRKKCIEDIILSLEKSIDFELKDRIRISADSNRIQYYLVSSHYDTHGKYIKSNDLKKAKYIIQNEYNLSLYKLLKIESKKLDDIIEYYKNNKIEFIYNRLHPGRQRLINPIFVSTNEYICKWGKVDYDRKSFEDTSNEYYTAKGERVRSKSEIIIADILDRFNIPYRYEYPIYFKGWGYVYADFYCLNVSTREEYVWEHFGMMDNEEYSKKAVSKIDKYLQNGYIQGKNFIATFETIDQPLNTKSIEKIIREFLF